MLAAGLHAATATVTVGKTVIISVTASGTAPFTYQWVKNGHAISYQVGRTLTIRSVTVQDSGTYTVMVINAVGHVTSTPAVLTVQAPGG